LIEGVILIGVGRNLNRAIRTCYSFGVYDVYCFNCTGKITGNLFSAADQVCVHTLDSLDNFCGGSILGLEANPNLPPLREYRDRNPKYIAVGGESTTLRVKNFPQMAHIPTTNKMCLTTEAALSIALYELSGVDVF